jgi:hypothetical protein
MVGNVLQFSFSKGRHLIGFVMNMQTLYKDSDIVKVLIIE